MENFGGDLELKRLDLTWSGQVDLTAATPRSKPVYQSNMINLCSHSAIVSITACGTYIQKSYGCCSGG